MITTAARRLVHRILRRVARPTLTSLGTHDLAQNNALSAAEYAHCVSLIQAIQSLYDDAPGVISRGRLDPEIFVPGNEWAGMAPTRGLKFKTAYNDINFLRLHAPFAGYHLSVLDRLDAGGKFSKKEAEEFVARLWVEGIPDDIAEQRARFDLKTRLEHVIPEYLEHLSNVPGGYIVKTPRRFGEIGLLVNGILANPDVVLCQSRINGLFCCGILDKLERDIERRGHARILEIGAGYGALAYALKNFYGDRLEYVIVDLPSSLACSAPYLSVLNGARETFVLGPDAGPPAHFQYLFIANHLLDRALPFLAPIDLAINTMSFPEMSVAQVRYYGNVIRQLIGEDGVLFEENAAVSPHHVDNKAIFAEIFPYRAHVRSELVKTKNWCQDVWTTRYLKNIFSRCVVPAS